MTRDGAQEFEGEVVALYAAHFERLRRTLSRLGGDSALGADLAQEAFVRLHARGALPEDASAWLITVALNLLRNERTTRVRRGRLLTPARGASLVGPGAPHPAEAEIGVHERGRVRAALERLPEREQQLLLLQSEGYRYREIASALALNESSIGVLLARARRAFRASYEESVDASRR